MINVAIFASGNGTNAQNIAERLSRGSVARVALIVASRSDAPVVERAARLGIDCVVADLGQPDGEERLLRLLRQREIRLIALAGYLKRVPESLIRAYPEAIVNIHPALLPKFGGRGMYGLRVHQAVIDSGEEQSGITIHYVNSRYDEGRSIGQWTCPVMPGDTPATLAQRVHKLEYAHYPAVIEQLAARIASLPTAENKP